MKQPSHDKTDLANKRLTTPHSAAAVEAAWQAELERRWRQMECGAVVCLPWDEVLTKLKATAHG